MNREYKFRVWNKKSQSWVHGPGEEVSLFGEMILLGGFMKNTPLLEILEDCNICQFTGVYDTNKVEIYEGDILEVLIADEEYLSPSVVVWSKYDETGFCLSNTEKLQDWQKPLIGHLVNNVELTQQLPVRVDGGYKIIGNIFENPDLIKKTI